MAQPRLHESPARRQAAYRQRVALARQQQLSAQSLPPLPALPTVPGQVRWLALLVQAQWCLDQVSDEMQQYYEARSQVWQESNKGTDFEERLEALQGVAALLEELQE